MADRHAREEVRQRALMQQRLAEKEKAQKEENLRLLAQRAREERAGIAPRAESKPVAERTAAMQSSLGAYGSGSESDSEPSEDEEDEDEADEDILGLPPSSEEKDELEEGDAELAALLERARSFRAELVTLLRQLDSFTSALDRRQGK